MQKRHHFYKPWVCVALVAIISWPAAGTGHAAPVTNGTVFGIDFGPTSTANWNNFNSNTTIPAGSVVDLDGTVVNGVSIVTAGGSGFNGDGSDGWKEYPDGWLSDVPDNATTDIVYKSGGGNITVTISGLNTNLAYDLEAVTSASTYLTKQDTITVTGAETYSASKILRSASHGGGYHKIRDVMPTAGGVITVNVSEPTGDNPIVNMIRIEAVTPPEDGTETLIGIDFGPTTTANWNSFTANGTIGAGSVVDLSGTVVPGISITASASAYNSDGSDGWTEYPDGWLSDVPDSATTDILVNNVTVTINNLHPSVIINLKGVTSASAGSTRQDTITVTGAEVYTASKILRSTSHAGVFHDISRISPAPDRTLTIAVTEPTANNPILNMLRLQIIKPPKKGTVIMFL